MANNKYGFISNRYIQPNRYKKLFCNWCASYIAKDGTEFQIEARPHHLSLEKENATIETYGVLRQDPDCRRTIKTGLKTQKAAIEKIEQLLSKHSNIE